MQVSGIDDEPFYAAVKAMFASRISLFGQEFYIAILWWMLFTIVATYVLMRTRFGNWIFAIGGDADASRNVGVPARGRPRSRFS